MNTGVADAVDLSWMLDAILNGWGDERLLNAYDLERRPVGIRNSLNSAHNYRAWVESEGYQDVFDDGPRGADCRAAIGRRLEQTLHGEWHSLGIELGYRYEQSPIIVPDGTMATADDITDYIPTVLHWTCSATGLSYSYSVTTLRRCLDSRLRPNELGYRFE
jgi:hypothetical protein